MLKIVRSILMEEQNQLFKVENFSKLHKQGTVFVLPNAWDVISAKVFEKSGFKAIGTTSAGIATSLGYKDGEKIPKEMMFEVIKRIANSVRIPVSADIEAGYGNTVQDVVNNVREIIEGGIVGINLEDGTGDASHPLYDIALQQEKIKAIRELSVSTDLPLFINARTDTYWLEIRNPAQRFHETVKRAHAYQEAGADCIFVPGLNDVRLIRELRKEITCPINLLVSPDLPSVKVLSSIGIERVSTGSAPFRSAVTQMRKNSELIMNQEEFHGITDDILSYGEVSDIV